MPRVRVRDRRPGHRPRTRLRSRQPAPNAQSGAGCTMRRRSRPGWRAVTAGGATIAGGRERISRVGSALQDHRRALMVAGVGALRVRRKYVVTSGEYVIERERTDGAVDCVRDAFGGPLVAAIGENLGGGVHALAFERVEVSTDDE